MLGTDVTRPCRETSRPAQHNRLRDGKKGRGIHQVSLVEKALSYEGEGRSRPYGLLVSKLPNLAGSSLPLGMA